MHQLLLGEDGFYDDVFRSLRIPYVPVQWVARPAGDARGRPRQGHPGQRAHPRLPRARPPHGRHRPARVQGAQPPRPRRRQPRPVAVGPRPRVPGRRLRRQAGDEAARRARRPARLLLPHRRHRVHAHPGPRGAALDPGARREEGRSGPTATSSCTCSSGSTPARPSSRSCRPSTSGRSASRSRAASRSSRCSTACWCAAAQDGLDEVAIGMPHRGRLNVLANIVGKSYAQIFREFEGNIDPRTAHGSGDVKYHLGAEGDVHGARRPDRRGQPAGQPLAPRGRQPGARGRRARQAGHDQPGRGAASPSCRCCCTATRPSPARASSPRRCRWASCAATAPAARSTSSSTTRSASRPARTRARSSVYATDVARMVQAPIFHVNGDDPEACVRVAKLAFDYRQAFKKDVVIDMVCYRRRGHSEVDEPSFTQPLMYDTIDKKRSVRKIYTENLIGRGDITVEEAEEALRDYQQQLEKVFQGTRDASSAEPMRPEPEPTGDGRPAHRDLARGRSTRVARAQVDAARGLHRPPAPAAAARRSASKMIEDATIDWAMGETLAYGSLLLEGRPVRLAGQDARRGTFGHRHAVIVDRATGGEHTPLAHLSPDQAPFYVYDSLLSEFAAMGFEYGYSVARPDALVLWEAQFGDFVNGAMTIVDEFIASGEVKWGQRSGVTLLLPHGYEGQGPDHSSARVERFLQLCAEDNMVVAAPTTPANYFHLLRRQALQSHQRPLVVLSPKSMLRLRAASLGGRGLHRRGASHRCSADPDPRDADAVDRVVLTAGKVHYDLLAARRKADDGRHGPRARRAALPGAGRGGGRRARRLPERHRRRVVPGGAGQPGRLVAHRAVAARPPARGPDAAPRLAQGRRLAGGRLEQGARGRAGGAHRGGAAGASARVLHRPRPRGAGRAARRGVGQPRRGWPSGCASSSTSTPTSRSRSSGWPPGWRDWTTTRSSRRRSARGWRATQRRLGVASARWPCHPNGWCTLGLTQGHARAPTPTEDEHEHPDDRHHRTRHRRAAAAVPGDPAASVALGPGRRALRPSRIAVAGPVHCAVHRPGVRTCVRVR